MLQKKLATLLVIFMICVSAKAQIQVPKPSPFSRIEQKVGLTDVSVAYSRPSVKGRKIFGDLVPFGKMWRTGANASTKIKFSKAVVINESQIEAGEYALYTIPSQDEWTIILHQNTSYWGTGGEAYKESEDALRFKVKPAKMSDKYESLYIGFENLTTSTADLVLRWENTKVAFQIDTEADAEIEQQIEQFDKNPEASLADSYHQSANYYLRKGKNLNKALDWIKKATKIQPKAYWMLRTMALIQAAKKDYRGAISTIKKSSEMAKERGNDGYVKMNKKSLLDWMKIK